MSTLTLSGWAQPATALMHAAREAVVFDYSDYADPDAAIAQLKDKNAEYCIAWSLGGMVALRAIARGVIRPTHLTLIGVPYQFVQTPDFSAAMGAETYQKFVENYRTNPARTKDRFLGLIAKGDSDAKRVLGALSHHPDVENTARWLPWLEWLGAGNLRDVAGADLPPTLIVQGAEDAIVAAAQAEKLRALIPNSTVSMWAETGHAPQVHDADRLRAEIAAHRKAQAV